MSTRRRPGLPMAAIALTASLTIILAACGTGDASLPALPSRPAVPSVGPDGSGAGLPSGGALPSAAAPTADLPSARPSEAATARPTEQPTTKPTEKPTGEPTAKPTTKPTVKPTAVPTPTPLVATKTCTTTDGAITNTYPEDWRTVEEAPEFKCMFFERGPVLISAETGYPLAAIHVVAHEGLNFNVAVLAAADVKYWRSVSRTPMTIGGLPAVLIVAIANGAGSYPRDTERYGWFIDWGTNGTIVMQTTGPEGDSRLKANKLVLDLMASKIVIKATP